MQIIPKNKLKYSLDKTEKQFKRRNIRKTNKILKRMDKNALMVSVKKTSRHISLSIFDTYYHRIATYNTTDYIEKDVKKNYCNIKYAEKIAKDSFQKIIKLEKFKNILVFNSGAYKYHGKIKKIDITLKEELEKMKNKG